MPSKVKGSIARPALRFRSIRENIPQGYVLGRTDSGTGEVQLISIAALAGQLVASGAISGSGAPIVQFLVDVDGTVLDALGGILVP